MSNTWELIVACTRDAALAEDLIREPGFRRELRVDPQKALLAFELRAKAER